MNEPTVSPIYLITFPTTQTTRVLARAQAPLGLSPLKVFVFQRHIPFLQAAAGSGVHLQQRRTIWNAQVQRPSELHQRHNRVHFEHQRKTRSSVYQQRHGVR